MILGKKILGTIGAMGGVPAVLNPFMWSLVQMVQYNQEYVCGENEIIHYVQAPTSFHAESRNYLVDNCYGDWLLMLDTDHSFEPDILNRMLKVMYENNIYVLSAIYQYKQDPYPPVLFMKNNNDSEDKKKNPFLLISEWDRSLDLLQVGSCGAGCLLIRKVVLDKIKNELKENPFDILPPHSEDHSFFKRLDKLNIPVFVAMDIECNHLMIKKIELKDYNDIDSKFYNHKIDTVGR